MLQCETVSSPRVYIVRQCPPHVCTVWDSVIPTCVQCEKVSSPRVYSVRQCPPHVCTVWDSVLPTCVQCETVSSPRVYSVRQCPPHVCTVWDSVLPTCVQCETVSSPRVYWANSSHESLGARQVFATKDRWFRVIVLSRKASPVNTRTMDYLPSRGACAAWYLSVPQLALHAWQRLRAHTKRRRRLLTRFSG